MAALTLQTIVNAGTKPTFSAATTSDTARINSGSDTFLVYKNTDATNSRTLTVVVPGSTDYGSPLPDPTFTLAAVNGEAWIPLRKAYDPGDGTGAATITMSGTGAPAGVTVALVQMG